VVRLGLLLLVLCSLPAGMVGATTLIKTYPVNLSVRDKALVTAAACGSVGVAAAEHLDAYTMVEGSTRISIDVRCKQHTTVGSFPVLRYSSCDNAKGTWRCNSSYDAIHVTLPDSRVLPVVADGVTALLAIEIITEATKLQVPPFHTPATHLMHGECSVSPQPDSPSPEMKLFKIICGTSGMLLTKHCWDKGCRYFISQGSGY
jgi:hypothetical protein